MARGESWYGHPDAHKHAARGVVEQRGLSQRKPKKAEKPWRLVWGKKPYVYGRYETRDLAERVMGKEKRRVVQRSGAPAYHIGLDLRLEGPGLA